VRFCFNTNKEEQEMLATLTNPKIKLFSDWFFRAFQENQLQPALREIIIESCTNELYGNLIQHFGLDFIEPFVNGSLDIDDLETFEANCPLNYAELETLSSLLYTHLKLCRYCRYLNSVYAGDEVEASNRMTKNFDADNYESD
jgi:hypothetical protein